MRYEVHNITTLTQAQARRHRLMEHLIKYGSIRKMAAECLIMYDLATRERILARVMRAAFRARRTAILPGVNKVAKSVISRCMKCRVQKK